MKMISVIIPIYNIKFAYVERCIKSIVEQKYENFEILLIYNGCSKEYESFMTITPCDVCDGQRLKRESLAVTVAGKNIYEITTMSIEKLADFLESIELTDRQQFIGGDGLVSKGVENTLVNIGRLGSIGMKETDKEIIRIMTGC